MTATDHPEEGFGPLQRYRTLSPMWRAYVQIAALAGTLLSINQFFNLGFFADIVLLGNRFQYIIVALFLPLVFILNPATGSASKDRVPVYDVILAALTVATFGYFAFQSENIVMKGWEMGAPMDVVAVGAVMCVLVIEAVRRAGGTALFVIVAVFSAYPLYADKLPGSISGLPATLPDTISYHTMSSESILGIPLDALVNLVIGFVIFGIALASTGGGKFFINLAFALVGNVRGGPAKVAIFASGLMGSMSGSVVSNVITTGVMTIPAMRRIGISKTSAGAIEACASTGAVLMPPIMGATAFVMATFLAIPYINVAAAAVIPSLLFYLALFVQIDAYAAKNNLPGIPADQLPSVRETLIKGWHYIFVFALLIFMLVVLKREVLAPFYATALLIVINQIFSAERWSWEDAKRFLTSIGELVSELTAILAGVGLIVGSLSLTGMAGTLVNDLLFMAGGEVFPLLIMGAITSFILGIGMTVTAAYIFLAVMLAPALTALGLNPLAVHLFILYWGMVSYITPPVALGAYAAASVAGADPMRTGLEAMRLGSVIYFVPFFFVMEPALILQGTLGEIVLYTALAMLGLVLVASALQGYLIGVGRLDNGLVIGSLTRLLLVLGGISLAMPAGLTMIGLSAVHTNLVAAALILGSITVAYLRNRRAIPAV